MDFNKLSFLEEDAKDTFNRFYPYHEEMQRLFGVPVYEERKVLGKYLTSLSNSLKNSSFKSSETDSGISSPNFADTNLNSSGSSLNSSAYTSTSTSDNSSNSTLDCFLKSVLSPRVGSSLKSVPRITVSDSCRRTPHTSTTSNYSLFGKNGLDLTSQITKKDKVGSSACRKCKCWACDVRLKPSADVVFEASKANQGGTYSDVLISPPKNPRLETEESRRTAPETTPSFTGFAFPTAARLKKEKPKACKFCKKNGELPEVYFGHETKDADDKVTCPILRMYVCKLCGATGDKAHTRKYCPNYVGLEERLPLFRRLANGVISVSHNHK